MNSLNTELCWLYFFFLHWLFPYGSQSSQIILENFILEFVCLSVCVCVLLWCIFLRIYSVFFFNFFAQRYFAIIIQICFHFINHVIFVGFCQACMGMQNLFQNNKDSISVGRVELFCLFVACNCTSMEATVLSCCFS